MLNAHDLLQARYRIVRPLGRGGMGAVYEAIDERFGEPIALKEILIETGEAPVPGQVEALTKAFERESKSLAKARHEAVPFVRDFFSEGSGQYLVMELVEGDDLARQLAKRGRPFPYEKGIEWMEQLLDALDYLHNLTPPIIHRDIKPQNLKLNSRGKIKLLDFGIAKSLDSGAFTITNQTFVGATLNYSPIEQLLRVMNPTFREYILLKHKDRAERILDQTTDCRSDIYALGATFYHLLTGAPPSDVIKRTLEVWEGRDDPLPPPSMLNADLPSKVSASILKALSIERSDRFGSAVEMRSFLFGKTAAKIVVGTSQVGVPRPVTPGPETSELAKPATGKTTEILLKWDERRGNLGGGSENKTGPAGPLTSEGTSDQSDPGLFTAPGYVQNLGNTDRSGEFSGTAAETHGSYDKITAPSEGGFEKAQGQYAYSLADPRKNGKGRVSRGYFFWAIPFGVMGILSMAVITAIAYIGWTSEAPAVAAPERPEANLLNSNILVPTPEDTTTLEVTPTTPPDPAPSPSELDSETEPRPREPAPAADQTETQPEATDKDVVPTEKTNPAGIRGRKGTTPVRKPNTPKLSKKGNSAVDIRCMFNSSCK